MDCTDGDGVAELGSYLRKPQSPKSIAIALDDWDQPGGRRRHLSDLAPPDGSAHVKKTGHIGDGSATAGSAVGRIIEGGATIRDADRVPDVGERGRAWTIRGYSRDRDGLTSAAEWPNRRRQPSSLTRCDPTPPSSRVADGRGWCSRDAGSHRRHCVGSGRRPRSPTLRRRSTVPNQRGVTA